MGQPIRHEDVQQALQRCGATWDAAQAHGLLSGRLAIAGTDAGFDWLSQVLEGTDTGNALRNECEVILSSLFESTYRSLSERRSEFEPLLPDDEDAAEARAAALAHWCEGFLHGLVSGQNNEVLKQKLGADPLAEIIKDILQITRAVADGDSDEDADDEAYVELVEYLRVAAQLTFEELAEFRRPAGENNKPEKTPEVLH
jgi:yecA family protein